MLIDSLHFIGPELWVIFAYAVIQAELMLQRPELFPPPLGQAVSQVYGYASNNGRHLLEGGEPSLEEAELIVGLSGVLCRYLGRKIPKA